MKFRVMVVPRFAATVVQPTVLDFLGQSLVAFRYSVEKIPLYDSAEDEPLSKLSKTVDASNSGSATNAKNECSMMNASVRSEHQLESTALVVQRLDLAPMDGMVVNTVKTEATQEMELYSQDAEQAFPQKNAMISRIRSNSACRNYHIGSRPMPKKRSKQYSSGKTKHLVQKHVDVKHVAQLLVQKEAQEEVSRYEEMKNEATSEHTSLYDEIRPAKTV